MYEWLALPFIFFIWMIARLATREAIFIPLPLSIIRKMLKLANAKRNDVVYDLGCGDGRVLTTAVKEFGCRAVGIEKNRILCWLVKRNIKNNPRIKLIEGNFFNQNLSEASVIFVYLSQKVNNQLKPKLERELKKGTRIVSANHTFGGWKEIKKIKTGHFYSHLYKV